VGLRAKPIIDIMRGAKLGRVARGDPSGRAAAVSLLSLPSRFDALVLQALGRRKNPPFARVPCGSRLWVERLAFRDHLRNHPEIASEYAELKERLAEQHQFDREAYTDAKLPFIERVLAMAGADRDTVQIQPYDSHRSRSTKSYKPQPPKGSPSSLDSIANGNWPKPIPKDPKRSSLALSLVRGDRRVRSQRRSLRSRSYSRTSAAPLRASKRA